MSSMAGEEGFEPSNGGTKNRCLATWRLPSIDQVWLEAEYTATKPTLEVLLYFFFVLDAYWVRLVCENPRRESMIFLAFSTKCAFGIPEGMASLGISSKNL